MLARHDLAGSESCNGAGCAHVTADCKGAVVTQVEDGSEIKGWLDGVDGLLFANHSTLSDNVDECIQAARNDWSRKTDIDFVCSTAADDAELRWEGNRGRRSRRIKSLCRSDRGCLGFGDLALLDRGRAGVSGCFGDLLAFLCDC